MRIPDSHWRLRYVAAAGLVLLTPLALWWAVTRLAPVDRRHGVTTLQETLGILSLMALLLGTAGLLVISGRISRQRYLRRMAALAEHALESTASTAHSGVAIDEIMPGAKRTGVYSAIIALILLCISYSFGEVLIHIVLGSLGVHFILPDPLFGSGSSDSHPELSIHSNYSSGTTLFLACAVVPLVWSVRILTETSRLVSRITLSSEGIVGIGVFGSRTVIPWAEARLLEMQTHGAESSQRLAMSRYLLYGESTIIRWQELSPIQTHARPSSVATAVTAYTYLQPLDAKRNDERSRSTANWLRSPLHRGWFGLAVSVLVLIGLSVSVETPAFGTALLILGCAIGAICFPFLPWKQTGTNPPIPAGIFPAPASGEAFTVSSSATYVFHLVGATIYRRNRVVGGVVGIGVLCLATVLESLVFIHRSRLPGHRQEMVGLSVMLLFFAVGATAMIALAVLEKAPPIVIADSEGLQLRTSLGSRRIRWQSVRRLVISTRSGAPSRYIVYGSSTGTTISWPARVPKVEEPPELPGRVLVSPSELVQIVVQQSGVTPEARRMSE